MLSPASTARWIGAAPRQRGSSERVDVQATEARNVQHGLRQQQAVRDDDHEVGRVRGEAPSVRAGVLERDRLLDRQPQLRARAA